MFRHIWHSLTTANALRKSHVPLDHGCWPCRLQNIPCPLESGSNGVCSLCRRFNIICLGVGQDFPGPSDLKQAAKAIRQWVAHSANRNPNVPPLNILFRMHLVINLVPVTAQTALERRRGPSKLLTNSFDRGIQIARQARVLGRFSTPLTSIANCTFAICQLILLCLPPDGDFFHPHPTERDHGNTAIAMIGSVFLDGILGYTSDLLLKGPLNDASVMEQAFEIILSYMTGLKQCLEEARQAVDMGCSMEDLKYILGLEENPPLHNTAGDGVDIGLAPQSDDAGVPGGPSTHGLAPGTREDGPNAELSSPSMSSDSAGTRSRGSLS